MLIRRASLLAVLVSITAAVGTARTVLKPGFNLFSKEQEIALGKKVSADVEKQMTVVSDAALNNYVAGLGRRLSRFAPDSDYPFTFKVIKDKNINAFALPGGPVYVHTGAIQAADNEGQLAGVLAHEIGHVVLRHGTNNASKAQVAQVPLSVLGGLLGSGGLAGELAAMAASFGVNSLFLKYSRDAERQADLIGTQILYDSGYDPEQMARFFEKLEQEQKQRPIEFLSDHPNPGNRITLVRREVQTLGTPKKYTGDATQFTAMRTQAASWSSRPDTRKKAAAGPAAPAVPSMALKNYNGRGFRISYPENWQVTAQESVVLIGPKEGISRDGISHGALISVFEPQENAQGRITLSDATNQLIAQLRRSNPGMRASGSRQKATAGGIPGESVMLLGNSPFRGENELDWLVTAQRPDGNLWYVVFIAPESEFQGLRPTFTKILESVQLAN